MQNLTHTLTVSIKSINYFLLMDLIQLQLKIMSQFQNPSLS